MAAVAFGATERNRCHLERLPPPPNCVGRSSREFCPPEARRGPVPGWTLVPTGNGVGTTADNN